MNTPSTLRRFRPSRFAWILTLVCGVGLVPALAQGTAFTYNGRLNDQNAPANGNYDLTFALFDALSGGTQQGTTLTNVAAGVTNGLFAVKLDFGPGIFTGADRWLELAVRTNGGGAFTTLSPRQAVMSTPYAMFATTSSNVADGAAVQTLNSLRDNVTLAAGDNVTITPNGNTLTIAAAGAGGSGIWSVNGNNTYYLAGNVGLGTAGPTERLTIAGVASYNDGLKLTGSSTAGTGLTLENTSSGGHKYALFSAGLGDGAGAGGFGLFDDTAGRYRLAVANNGYVGIGTGTNLPQHQLDVVASKGSAIAGHASDVGAVGVFGESRQFEGVRGEAYDANHGALVGVHHGGGWAVYGVSGGIGVVGETTNTSGFGGYFRNLGGIALQTEGSIQVLGQDGLRVVGYQPFVTLLDNNAGYARGRIQSAGGNLIFQTEAYLNGSNPRAYVQLDGQANLSTATLTIRGGADLAEPFPMKETAIEKGSVVVIDPEHPGRLRLSTKAYDKRVAGIVSGANGIKPGIALKQEGEFDQGENVALTGRVYVKADASSGAIKPGDLLTTSDTPGHAMTAADPTRAQGAILGKAMSSLAEGRGFVLVLVTLQ